VRTFGALLVLVAVLGAGAARATPGDRVINYRGGGQGRVSFDVRTHAKAGLRCRDCHDALFPTRRTGLISRAEHQQGSACFACHDGKQASAECASCHRQ
jgi:phosphate transport system substrate-binding protein